jgi:hypothetical protein
MALQLRLTNQTITDSCRRLERTASKHRALLPFWARPRDSRREQL